MTPQEIFEYKQQWMSSGSNNPVQLHSDLVDTAKTWCRRNLGRHQWSMRTYTDVYEHTFFFEAADAAQNFAAEVDTWTNK